MNQPSETSWLLRVVQQQPGLLLVVGAMPFLLLLLGVAYYLDGRLGEIEDQLNFVPPSNYAAPDLAAHQAELDAGAVTAQHLVYVPVYSHIYHEGGAPYSLETTLSLRNVDQDQPVYFSRVDYFDTEGKKVKSFLKETIKLAPLETIEFLVERQDTSGGSGANFLVEWLAVGDVDRPVIEAVMVGTSGTHGISFSRAGIEISPATPASDSDQSE